MMSELRLIGGDGAAWPRRPLEDARWAALGGNVPPAVPVCTAPFAVLVADSSCWLRPCVPGSAMMQRAATPAWQEFWQGNALDELRQRLQRGELPADHCGSCATLLRAGLAQSTPPIHDYGRDLPADQPRRLVVRFVPGRNDWLDEAAAAALRPLLDVVGIVEVDCVEPPADTSLDHLLGLLRETTREGRSVELTTTDTSATAAARFAGVPLARLRLRVDSGGPVQLEELRDVAAGCEVELLLTPASWYRIPELAERCTASHAELRLRVAAVDGTLPLVELPLVELRALHFVLQSWWPQLGERPPGCLQPQAYTHLLDEVRAVVARAVALATECGPAAALAGRQRLQLPAPDHVAIDRAPWQQQTLPPLFGLGHSASLIAWATELVAAPEALGVVRERAWLRVLLQKLSLEDPSLPMREFLRRVYADPALRPRLLAAEAEAMRMLGLADAAQEWVHAHGLDAPPRRERPFRIEPRPPPPAEHVPDVTVLVPAYRHELFIRETLRSVLAQTHANFRLLVVDDRSPDATAEAARSFADPRIEVRVNPQNLGLGNSVLRALDRIETPYVALLNSDDLFHPERLERSLRVLEKNPGCEVVTTGVAMIDIDGHRLTAANASPLLDTRRVADLVRWFEQNQPDHKEVADPFLALLRRNFLVTSSNLCCRTEYLRRNADALRSLKYCLDWQLFLDAAAAGALVHLPEQLVAYRLHADNTVWFRDGSRWRYYLEVNRVAARGLRSWVARLPADASARRRCTRTLRAILGNAAANSEVDGLALYLNELLDPLLLEQVVRASVWARREVAARDATVQEVPVARHLFREFGPDPWRAMELLRGVPALRVAEVERDTLRAETGSLRGALQWTRAESERLSSRAYAAERRVSELDARLTELLRETQELRTGADHLQQQITEHERERATLQTELQLIGQARERLAHRHADLLAELQSLRSEHAALLLQLGQMRTDLAAARVQWQAEISELRRSREYRLGEWFWNRVPGVRKSARLLKWCYRRASDLCSRIRLATGRLLRRPRSRLRAVVAATGRFPIGSHTFVYREMLGIRDAGLDLRLFYWVPEPRENLHAEFARLRKSAIRLQSVWSIHEADLVHWKRTQPQRVESLLARIEEVCGIPAAELERRWELMQAFTFARMAEQWGADYVHSYFFYEQSLAAMVTAWLLGIPRGITAYVDHVLDDWPLKLVALHIELAEVVVATSMRIKQELVAIAGERFADKILVKPNGPDGRRFDGSPLPRHRAGPFPLVSVSRIEPKKGLLTLVDAVRILKDRGRSVVVHLVGAPDRYSPGCLAYAEQLSERIRDLDVDAEFVLHGFRDQAAIARLLRGAQVFVAPYVETETGDKDGIPTAMLEAMASGLPVLTTDAGSIPEVVEDGVEGRIVPQYDAVGLAGAIERMIDDEAGRLAMGRRARARFEREFDGRITEQRLRARIRAVLGLEQQADIPSAPSATPPQEAARS